jgi:hypothetical protein
VAALGAFRIMDNGEARQGFDVTKREFEAFCGILAED